MESRPCPAGTIQRSSILLTLALGFVAYGCGSEPATAPTTAKPKGPPRIVNVDMVGPGTRNAYLGSAPTWVVAPGETAQFRAFANFDDGSRRDVTSEATWASSNHNYLSAAGSGQFTGQKPGTAAVIADIPLPTAYHAAEEVIVMAPNTYVLAGQIFESRDPLGPVDRAVVTVMAGTSQGQSVEVNGFNGYRLYGLAGPTRLRVSKDGYRTQELTVSVSDHQLLDIDLPLLVPRVDVSGAYTLTVTAADECAIGRGDHHVTEEARERRYAAFVTQNGPMLSMELSGAAFVSPMATDSRILGTVEPGRVLFDLFWWAWDFGLPYIVEKLPTGETLVVSGWAETMTAPRGLAGTLNGSFGVTPAGVTPGVGVASAAHCLSSAHRFALSR